MRPALLLTLALSGCVFGYDEHIGGPYVKRATIPEFKEVRQPIFISQGDMTPASDERRSRHWENRYRLEGMSEAEIDAQNLHGGSCGGVDLVAGCCGCIFIDIPCAPFVIVFSLISYPFSGEPYKEDFHPHDYQVTFPYQADDDKVEFLKRRMQSVHPGMTTRAVIATLGKADVAFPRRDTKTEARARGTIYRYIISQLSSLAEDGNYIELGFSRDGVLETVDPHGLDWSDAEK